MKGIRLSTIKGHLHGYRSSHLFGWLLLFLICLPRPCDCELVTAFRLVYDDGDKSSVWKRVGNFSGATVSTIERNQNDRSTKRKSIAVDFDPATVQPTLMWLERSQKPYFYNATSRELESKAATSFIIQAGLPLDPLPDFRSAEDKRRIQWPLQMHLESPYAVAWDNHMDMVTSPQHIFASYTNRAYNTDSIVPHTAFSLSGLNFELSSSSDIGSGLVAASYRTKLSLYEMEYATSADQSYTSYDMNVYRVFDLRRLALDFECYPVLVPRSPDYHPTPPVSIIRGSLRINSKVPLTKFDDNISPADTDEKQSGDHEDDGKTSEAQAVKSNESNGYNEEFGVLDGFLSLCYDEEAKDWLGGAGGHPSLHQIYHSKPDINNNQMVVAQVYEQTFLSVEGGPVQVVFFAPQRNTLPNTTKAGTMIATPVENSNYNLFEYNRTFIPKKGNALYLVNATRPGLWLSYNRDYTCSSIWCKCLGNFRIWELDYDVYGIVHRLAVDFELGCGRHGWGSDTEEPKDDDVWPLDQNGGRVEGWVRLRSDRPVPFSLSELCVTESPTRMPTAAPTLGPTPRPHATPRPTLSGDESPSSPTFPSATHVSSPKGTGVEPSFLEKYWAHWQVRLSVSAVVSFVVGMLISLCSPFRHDGDINKDWLLLTFVVVCGIAFGVFGSLILVLGYFMGRWCCSPNNNNNGYINNTRSANATNTYLPVESATSSHSLHEEESRVELPSLT